MQTPSENSAKLPPIDEANFLVASSLLPASWRPAIRDFYHYFRGLDDIADSTRLSREEKREQLRVVRLGFSEMREEMIPPFARGYFQRVQSGEVSFDAGQDFWQACWQDTEKQRYRNIAELLSYCRHSAVPVGRLLMQYTQEPAPKLAALDALCIVMQLLNHVQGVHEDYIKHGRVYLPQDWLAAEGISDKVLAKREAGPRLRRVLNRLLDEVDSLLRQAGHAPRSIRQRGLRWELRIMLAWARALSRKLRREDPMARYVHLSRLHRALLAVGGVIGLA